MSHLHDAPRPASRAAAPHRRIGAVALVALAVLGLHLVVVREVSGHTARAPATPATEPALRRVVLAPLPESTAAATPPTAATVPTAETGAAPAAPTTPDPGAARTAEAPAAPAATTVADASPPSPAPAPQRATPPADAPAPAAPFAAPPPDLPPAGILAHAEAATSALAISAMATAASATEPTTLAPTPTYAASPPRAAVLRYRLTRGLLSGEGSLQWRPQGARYELTLEARVLGFEVLQQRSSGGFDAAGLAPVRFTDRRKGRDLQAANFQRDKALVTFSGPSTQWPLPAGAQDRVSWLVQLAAIANARSADPLKPGERLQMPVFGARGDASIWTFVVVGTEPIALQADGPAARTNALRLRRQPDRPHDTHADAWLDPSRQHLPVKVEIGNEGSDPLQLQLIGESAP